MDLDKTAHRAVLSGSTLFVCMLKLGFEVNIHMQLKNKMTFLDTFFFDSRLRAKNWKNENES